MLTEVKAGNYTVRGVSLGGIYTSLMVPEIGTMFDVGIAPRSFAGAKRLFLSHGHVDHIGALASFLGIRALTGKRSPLRVYLPAEIVDDLTAALAVLGGIQRYSLEIEAIGMKPGDEISLGDNLKVRAFRTFHPVPSLGYMFIRRVDKLRPQYRKLAGPEIAKRRLAGDDLFDVSDRLELAYATDTLAKVLDAEPALMDVRTLILECTFLNERKTLKDVHAGCHIHLDELIDRSAQFNNEQLVLMHFSQLYKPAEVHQILAERCPEELRKRLVAFAPESGNWPG